MSRKVLRSRLLGAAATAIFGKPGDDRTTRRGSDLAPSFVRAAAFAGEKTDVHRNDECDVRRHDDAGG